MILNYCLDDKSAKIASEILMRGEKNFKELLRKIGKGGKFVYVACPDFSISLRQRRLIIGLPIGGYVKWESEVPFFPIELDINSCGVHIVKLENYKKDDFLKRLFALKARLDKNELVLDGKTLKWNFTRRNHFINVYKDDVGNYYMITHSSGETRLFDWADLRKTFAVKTCDINGRELPYISGNDVSRYAQIASEENDFFFKRHKYLFDILLDGSYEMLFADQHFGMISPCEVLMGCSKLKIGAEFPILTRPFEELIMCKTKNPPKDMLAVTNGFALVPHGLGMTVADNIEDIVGLSEYEDYVEVKHINGCGMITNTLEYAGIDYRYNDVIPQMAKNMGFSTLHTLTPVLFTKL